MVSVRLEDVTKRFGESVVVDQVDLQISDGEFYTLLGPSGCGKTTTLRIVAGFYRPDQGNIYFDTELMNDVPPFKRDTGMVFQTYALWPHMNIRDNVSYGLTIRKVPKDQIEKKVSEALGLVGLEGFEKRLPSELSGGQQQRVALARALVIEPKVLLLDEPLSNLDAKLRVQTRVEITRLQKKLGITTIYVTHDQEEALCISDRIAVMSKGRIQQVASPRVIYERPGNQFVADFIGVANFLKGTLAKMDAKSKVATVETEDSERFEVTHDGEIAVGSTVLISFRPEVVEMEEDGKVAGAVNQIEGRIRIASYLGDMVRYEVEAKDKIFRVDIHNPAGKKLFAEGKNVRLSFSSSSARIVPI
ncbi:ABC transporter ATP-binding protein [Candidatus Bathyarchaeota archaeon]|nr:ABC transporter ATP-binding protein [Candidatus Bathyarchaeota archaeon]